MSSIRCIKIFSESTMQAAVAAAMLKAGLKDVRISVEFVEDVRREETDVEMVVDNFVQCGKYQSYDRVLLLGNVCDHLTLESIDELDDRNFDMVVTDQEFDNSMIGFDWITHMNTAFKGDPKNPGTYALWVSQVLRDLSISESYGIAEIVDASNLNSKTIDELVEISQSEYVVNSKASEYRVLKLAFESISHDAFLFSVYNNLIHNSGVITAEDAAAAERLETYAANKKMQMLRDSCIVSGKRYVLSYAEGVNDTILEELISWYPDVEVVICVSLSDRAVAYCVNPDASATTISSIDPNVEFKMGKSRVYNIRVMQYDPLKPVVFWRI